MTTEDNSDVNDSSSAVASTPTPSAGETKAFSFEDIKDAKGVSLQNRFGEVARKLNKLSDLESKIDQLLTVSTKSAGSVNDYAAASSDYDDVDQKINSRLKALEAERLQSEHLVQFENLKKKYNELDKNSESYDPDFYRLADNYYKQFNLQQDPKGAIKAVEFAAYETGKIKQQAEKEVLQDEKRRSRKLAEGAGEPKKASGEDIQVSQKTLSKLGIKSKYLEKAMKNLRSGE